DFFSFTLNAGDSVFLGLDMDPGRVASNTAWNGRVGLGPFNNFILVANDGSTTKPHAEAFFMTVQQAGTYYAYVDSTSTTGLGPNARYHLSVSIYPKAIQGNCTTFTSTDVPKAIGPGVGTTTSTITVPGTVTSSIEDVNATIVLTHTNMLDLDVTLVGPTMVSTPLFTDIGASSQTQMNVGLDDQAALPIGLFTVVSGMKNQPEQPGRLYSFNGTPAAGTWTLQLADDLAANGGILQSWSLEICGDPPPDYGIELIKTVGMESNVCAATDSVTVPPGGFDVYYCYTVRNTGLNTLTTHDLVDSELGAIFTDMPYSLAPGASYSHIVQATVYDTVTNTATWTADDGVGSATDSDTATVNVPSFCPAGYRDVTVDYSFFDNPFPPAGWSVTNTTTNCNATGAVPEWTNTNPGNRANLTGGAGPFAIADSDKCGSGNLMDTIMSTGALDFTGLISPTIRYNTDYYDLSPAGGAQALLDLSTDGGATWSNLLTWNGSQRGPLLVTQALTGAAGQSDARVRWHYAQASWDWWWQVDNALITACEPIPANPAITLDKTVGTDPNVCAVTDEITVAAGTEVTYCYEVTNTGDVTFSLHDLDDSELGTILSNFPYTLAPSASAFLTATTTINVTTVNTATWTAYELFDGGGVSSTDTATVTVEMQDPPNIYVNPLSLASTQPPDVQMQEMLNVANTGGGTLNWSIAEENTPFAAGVPSQAMNAAAGSQTLSAAGSFASGMQPVA
ncbi:MAG TPA: proprotein convertase P-domain-containing protein, partial [Anaerolineae bacterium]|nr:proprotein convertase P-domain-containing protein [Anaerolineae bacterium]